MPARISLKVSRTKSRQFQGRHLRQNAGANVEQEEQNEGGGEVRRFPVAQLVGIQTESGRHHRRAAAAIPMPRPVNAVASAWSPEATVNGIEELLDEAAQYRGSSFGSRSPSSWIRRVACEIMDSAVAVVSGAVLAGTRSAKASTSSSVCHGSWADGAPGFPRGCRPVLSAAQRLGASPSQHAPVRQADVPEFDAQCAMALPLFALLHGTMVLARRAQ